MKKNREILSSFSITTAVILIDVLFILTADLFSFVIRFADDIPPSILHTYFRIAPFVVVLRLIFFHIFRLYAAPKDKSSFETFIGTLKAVSAGSIIIVLMIYFIGIEIFPRSLIIISWFVTTVFISCWRLLTKELIGLSLGQDYTTVNILIIGTGRDAYNIALHASRDVAVDTNLLGFVGTGEKAAAEIDKEKMLGSIDEMASLVKRYRVDEVIVADPQMEKAKLAHLSRLLNKEKISLKTMAAAYETMIADMVLHEHGESFIGPAIFAVKASSWYWGVKRILDMAVSAALLLLTLPILLAAILAIKITSPGGAFYFQKRTGQHGKPFLMYKLRTMYAASEKARRARWATEDDLRITPVGKLLRRFRIDELPQIVNVLRNEMSLIGPRPERPYFTTRLMKKIPFYAERLQVKPGISGWAQVNLSYADSEKDAEEKLLYDIFYVQNMSFSLDLLVVLKTLRVVIGGKGAH